MYRGKPIVTETCRKGYYKWSIPSPLQRVLHSYAIDCKYHGMLHCVFPIEVLRQIYSEYS